MTKTLRPGIYAGTLLSAGLLLSAAAETSPDGRLTVAQRGQPQATDEPATEEEKDRRRRGGRDKQEGGPPEKGQRGEDKGQRGEEKGAGQQDQQGRPGDRSKDQSKDQQKDQGGRGGDRPSFGQDRGDDRGKAAEDERQRREREKAEQDQRAKAAEDERQRREREKAGQDQRDQGGRAAEEERQRKDRDKADQERRLSPLEKLKQFGRDRRDSPAESLFGKREDLRSMRRKERAERKFNRIEDLQKQRRERVEEGGKRRIIEEADKRVITRDGGRAFIRHDESERFRRYGRNSRTERRPDGTTATILVRPGGIEIITIVDADGRLVRRSRRERGREVVLIDNRRHGRHGRHGRSGSFLDFVIDLRPPVVRIPRAKYIVDYDDASEDDYYEALSAPPLERFERGYSLDEIRYNRYLRERMRRIDLDINFAFGQWDVDESQYFKLERVARAIQRLLRRNSEAVVMVEGHTDAVGSDIDNLTLSDRRAETVAEILTDEFDIPPENLVTQGYGEEFLKVETQAPERRNRRVTFLNLSPMLARADRDYRD